MKKYVIGLGCSWTQGEGGYPDYIWKLYKGRVNLKGSDEHLRCYEHENSWVNVLCKQYFKDHIPINLGVRGIGNKAAVKQLYFCDNVDFNNSSGYIILLLSGFERYDFFQREPLSNDKTLIDYYSDGSFRHYKWRTMWPFDLEGNDDRVLWNYYAEHLHSDQFICAESLMAMLELQTFCKAHNFKMIVANAYNPFNNLKNFMKSNLGSIVDKFDWKYYLHEKTNYTAMMEKLVELDNAGLKKENWQGFYDFYQKFTWPSKYITNCNHPTVDGYKVIAEELYKFIKSNGN